MTINEFNNYLQTLPCIEDQLVYLRYKYDWENEWVYSNEILTVDMNIEGYYCWLKDWNEGQQDVEILGCIAISDISVPRFIDTSAKKSKVICKKDYSDLDWSGAQGNDDLKKIKEEQERGYWGIYG